MGALQLFDPAVQGVQQPVLLVHHPLPHRRVDEEGADRLRLVDGAVPDAARGDPHPQDVVVGPDGPGGGRAVQRCLVQHAQAPSDTACEGVLQRARPVRRGAGGAVLPFVGVPRPTVERARVLRRVRMFRTLQLPQFDAAQQASLQRPADQGVAGALGRTEQQRAGLQPAQEVPVPGLRGVHREQVQSALDDQPQDERALQGQAAYARAVDGPAQGAQSGHDRVDGGRGVGRVCHLSAP